MTYLTRREAAAYLTDQGLPCSYRALCMHAINKTGPALYRFGRDVRYTKADLDKWVAATLVRESHE